MSKTRNLSDLLDANGDVKSGALDNVPASNDASALTTGTLPNARLSSVPNSALANSSINVNSAIIVLSFRFFKLILLPNHLAILQDGHSNQSNRNQFSNHTVSLNQLSSL